MQRHSSYTNGVTLHIIKPFIIHILAENRNIRLAKIPSYANVPGTHYSRGKTVAKT